LESTYRKNTRFEILTPSGFSKFDGIMLTKHKNYFKLTTINSVLKCTPNHKILTEFGYKKIVELQLSDKIYQENDFEEIIDIEYFETTEYNDFYDPVGVEKGNEYYSEKILSHNCMEFMGSSGTLISGWKLKELEPGIPIDQKEGFKQFDKPIQGRSYIISADCSEGKGLDYSAFHVIDVSSKPFKQAATYRSNIITPVEYADFLYEIGKIYNDASILVELNAIGSVVTHILYNERGYDNMIMTENAGPAGKKISQGYSGKALEVGIRTTKVVKGKGCSLLKMLVEQNQLNIIDSDTIFELSRFSRKGSSWEAEDNSTDDLVMGLVLFAWLTDQTYFKELTDIDILPMLRDRNEQQIINSLTPFMVKYDATEEHYTDLDGKNEEGWVIDNTEPRIRIYF